MTAEIGDEHVDLNVDATLAELKRRRSQRLGTRGCPSHRLLRGCAALASGVAPIAPSPWQVLEGRRNVGGAGPVLGPAAPPWSSSAETPEKGGRMMDRNGRALRATQATEPRRRIEPSMSDRAPRAVPRAPRTAEAETELMLRLPTSSA